MNKEDLGYLQERIDVLEEHYQKKNIGDVILKIANKLEKKRPSLKDKKEILMERAYALTQGLLEKTKGFDTFEWMIPVALKGPSDWNGSTIRDVIASWQSGNLMTREKLVEEGRVMVHDDKVVSKILKYHFDPDGSYVIDEAEYVDYDDENSLPLVRDTKKEFKPGSPNFNYGRPLYPRYHIDLHCLVGVSDGNVASSKMINMRYQKSLADPTSESFVGDTLFAKSFRFYENMRAQIVKEDPRLNVYNGNTSIWEKETEIPDIDLRITEALPFVEDAMKVIVLSDLADEYNSYFKVKGKVQYDRLGLSEVTVKRTEIDRFGRTVLYLSDPSLDVTDLDVRGYVADTFNVEFPVLPCQAMVTYYVRQRDGAYDPKLRQRVEGKTYELGITGIKFVEGGGLTEEDKAELEELLGE